METKKNSTKIIFFTKLTQKHGISLITLVITIIVVIILAAAVVMSLNNNNVLTNASSARYTTDLDTMQSYLELAIQKVTLRHQGTLEIDSGEVEMDATSNVKDSKGTITWESTDIGNLSGQIIFDEGTDTDTIFYTGYKLPVYGSETKWYVDDNGKLVLQTGSRIYGADEIPKAKINAATILKDPQKYYGAYVDYKTANTLSEEYKWRIFYATNNNIFLISSDYINVNDLPITSKGHKSENANSSFPKGARFNNILSDYSGSANITEDMKWLNKDYFDKAYTSTNNNMKAIAYMLDESIWTEKFNGIGTNYVIGGPPIEMLLTSYNQKTNQNNMYQSRAEDEKGYKISEDNGINWIYYFSTNSKYLTQGNELYRISNKSKAQAYWISSPSIESTNSVMRINYAGNVDSYYYYGTNMGFRPIVCLKSGIKLKEVESGISYQI